MTRVLKRPVLGFATGAITGGALVASFITLGYATSYPVEGGTFIPDARNIAAWAIASFVLATIVWTVGLAVVGYPVWRLLDSRGVKGPLAAILFGLTAVYSVGLLWPPASLTGLLEPSRVLLAICGSVVGLVIERVAYRPIKPPPAPPS